MRTRPVERPTPRAGSGLSATVAVIVAEMQRRGFDASPLLGQHGLDHALLEQATGRYPRHAVLDFVADANALVGDPAMHVHASHAAELGVFRYLDQVALMSPKVGVGFRAVFAAFAFVNDAVRFEVRESDAKVVIDMLAVYEPHPDPLEIACTFMVFERRLRNMTHELYGLEAIELRAPADAAGLALRQHMPESQVRFDRPVDRFVFSREAWDSTPLLSHPVVAQVQPIISGVRDWFVAVEDAIRARLALGEVGAPTIATALGTSERSLQRRLQERGTSFMALLDGVRQSEAFRLLRARLAREGVADIAARLGYSETSAFTRAFRRWTGKSPREWRKKVVD